MSQILKSGKEFLAELFAQSQTSISEKLSAEEFAQFKAELDEAKQQINSQLEGNTQLKADYDAAVLRADAAEGKVKDLEPKLTEANSKVTTLTAENQRLDTWFQAHKGAVNGTTTSGDQSQGSDDPSSKFKAGSVMHAALGMFSK